MESKDTPFVRFLAHGLCSLSIGCYLYLILRGNFLKVIQPVSDGSRLRPDSDFQLLPHPTEILRERDRDPVST